jgi:hypothetical protein
VLPAGYKAIVTRLDAATFTSLLRGLLQAEAESLGLPANTVVVSDALTEGDGGLDARVENVPEHSQTLPVGLVGFQFKAYKKKTIGSTEFETEIAKAGPTRILKARGTYVLAWQADLNDRQRNLAEATMHDEAAKIVDDPRCKIWDASTVVALSEKYPAVVAGLELVHFGAVLGLPEMEDALRVAERPYESDEQRSRAIEQIRSRAKAESEDTTVVTLSGLAGTGKTRLVVEALNTDELRDRVVYAGSPEGLQTFISTVVRDQRSSGILVADEVDDGDRRAIHTRFAATRGRWRLLAIVPQQTPRLRASGARDIVLAPLAADATRRLIESTSGLPEFKARMVADVAQGFPELAFRLAEELQLDPDLDLVRLAHLDQPKEVLERALPDKSVRDGLKPLALFTGLGTEGDLAYQLEEVAEAFGQEPAAIRQVVEIELLRHRFVSAAGRYRSVSPSLVAVWLAAELIDETPELDKIIGTLSEPVQEAFYGQLELFGPNVGQLALALERLLSEQRFRDPRAFDEAAGRFLRASAAAVPSQVASAIDELLSKATPNELKTLPRRDLVWALQVLLWWPETWESAVNSLYRLALHENEGWANNATGSFAGAFPVYLAGTTVPFSVRIAWLRSRIASAEPDELPLLRQAAQRGLARHHHRMIVGFRGGGEPEDWRPATAEELRTAHRESWAALVDVLDRSPQEQRLESVKGLAMGLATLALDGLFDVVERNIRDREWNSKERAEFLANVQQLSRYGSTPEHVLTGLTGFRRWLEGGSSDERLTTVLATPVWELRAARRSAFEDPPVLLELADEFTQRPEAATAAIAVGRDSAETSTRFRWLTIMASRLGSAAIVDAASKSERFDLVAYAAAMAAAAEEDHEWVDRTLRELATGDHADQLPQVASYAPITNERAALVLDVIASGRASAGPLANWRGGVSFTELPDATIEAILRALVNADAVEDALGMLLQYLEAKPEIPDWVRDLALDFATSALLTELRDTMIEYYVKEFVKRGLFDRVGLAALWGVRMRHRDGLVEELDLLLTDKALGEAPAEMLLRVLELVREEAAGEASFSIFASRDLALLSQAAQALGSDVVWEGLADFTEHEFRIAIHHMRWSGETPDPLVERFLSSPRLEGHESEAFTAFFNTLGIVSGDYWRALIGERDRAASWREHLTEPSARAWAEQLVQSYEHDIKTHRAREEEEDFRLGR